MTEIKFCGLTRADDATFAGELGAAYLGVIFAGGPRKLDAARAGEVLGGCTTAARRVGVFGDATPRDIGKLARQVALDVVQLHADPTAETVRAVREETDARIWAVVRVTHALPANVDELFAAADALLIDARVPGALGGSGAAVDWASLRPALAAARGGRRVVLAGGLAPGNVARAVTVLRPDIVDVSSGVEAAPGIKDHARMRAFAEAVAASAQEKR